MSRIDQEGDGLSELTSKLELIDTEAENTETGEKSKSKKKPKKKKSAGKSEPQQRTDEFKFSSSRASLIKVGHDVIKGRTLIAASLLPAGTLYFSELAVATVSHSNELCMVCGKAVSVCGLNAAIVDPTLPADLFCTEHCRVQVASYPLKHRYHQLLSQHIDQIAAANSCDKDLMHMVFRLLALSLFPVNDAAPTEDPLCVDNGTTLTATLRAVNTLEAHLEQQPVAWKAAVSTGLRAVLEVLSADAEMKSLMDAVQSLGLASSAATTTSNATYVSTVERVLPHALFLACIVNVNAYGIVDYSAASHSMGFGLFPAVGLCVNHACHPNSYYAYNPVSGSMEYRTLRAVAVGEELTVSYTDIFLGTPQRRAALYEKRFFSCQCSRCTGYDMAEAATVSICRSSTAASTTSKKKRSKEEEAARALLSPFYRPSGSSGNAAADALLDDWADEPVTKPAKGKSKANKSNVADSAPMTATVSTGTSDGKVAVAESTECISMENILADAKLSGFHCENCGEVGVVVAVSNKETEPCAACIVCTAVVNHSAVQVSLERCSVQWRVCQDTVKYAAPGPACATLIEKFLQEADPEYAHYTSCTLSAAGSSSVSSGLGSAQAIAMEKRRRVKCPVQLHAQHATLAEAYMLLYDHMWVQYQQAEQSGSGTAATSSTLSRVLYCLRRALRTKRTLLQPTAHLEVAATQCLLAHVLQTAMRHGSKGSVVVKELRKECVEVLNEVITARTNAFGKEHGLTQRVNSLLLQVEV